MSSYNSWKKINQDTARRAENNRDVLLDTDNLRMNRESGQICGTTAEDKEIKKDIDSWALKQLLQKANMPVKYFRKLYNQENYSLVANNLDFNFIQQDRELLFRLKHHEGREKIRAVLTKSYSIFDDEKVFGIAGQKLRDRGIEHNIIQYKSEGSFTIARITFPRTERDVSEKAIESGDILKAGILIMNSEVGASGVRIMPIVQRLICKNGLASWETDNKKKYYRKHRGLDKEEMEKFADEAIDQAIDQSVATIDDMKQLKQITVDDVEEAIRYLAKDHYLTKATAKKAIEKHNCLWHNHQSMYSIINSFTNVARDENEQKRLKIEKAAGKATHKFAA